MKWIPNCFQIVLSLCASALLVAGDAIVMPDEASIRATLNEISEVLKPEDAGLLDGLNQRIQDLSKTIEQLKDLEQKESSQRTKLQSMLETANADQLKNLEDRLQQILLQELNIRERERLEHQKLETLLEERRSKTSQSTEDVVVEVTPSTLAERLDTNAILEDSEEEMKRWVLSVVESEIQNFKKEILNLANTQDTQADSTASADCPSLTKIVQSVQQALNQEADDGIGLKDYAQGASVVHWLTSKTYAPPSSKLGQVWWNKFIPQDWERLLPEGWEEWQVGIPSYLYHSLGFMTGSVAPPEAVLQTNTLPGSCWPMEGSSGQIVLKLQQPVVIESVSVDHISNLIVGEGKHTSAPKKLKVIGYPECDHPGCVSTGFDLSDPIAIADFQYDAQDGPSIQTFDSHYTTALASIPAAPTSLDGDSCDTSCSKPPKQSVAAIEVRVLENWGNFEYTCLYRLRVHGEPM